MITAIREALPPTDVEAEAAVIASLLVDPTAIEIVSEIVDAADFHWGPHSFAFSACHALWRRGETLNQVTVAHELARSGKLEDCGGLPWLAQLVRDLVTPVGVEHYARIVKRDSTYRALISAGSEIVRIAYEGGADLPGAIQRSEALLRSVAGGMPARGVVSLAAAVNEFWEVGAMHEHTASFSVRTGFGGLDKLITGFQSGNFVVIAARPSKGKSALLLALARNAAVGQNARIVICTLEMNRREWAVRLLSHEAGIDSRRIASQGMSELEERRAMDATGSLSGLNIQLADGSTQTVSSLRSAVRRGAAAMGGVDLVMVDYLQLMQGERRHENRNAEVTEISRGLKMLAGDFNVPVVAAAQLSREVERRKPPIPVLSDLRDSGAIEQDADVAMFLHRPNKDGAPGEFVKVIVAKNRNGPLGSMWLRMTPPLSRFEEIGGIEEESA